MTKKRAIALIAVFVAVGTAATVAGVLSIPRLTTEITIWYAFRKIGQSSCANEIECRAESVKELGERAEGPVRRRLYNAKLDESTRQVAATILMDMGKLRPDDPFYDEAHRHFCRMRAWEELGELLKKLVATDEGTPLKRALESVCRQAGAELACRAPDDAVRAPVGGTWAPLEEALDDLTGKAGLYWYAKICDYEGPAFEIVVLTREQAMEAFQAALDAPLPAGSKTLNDAIDALPSDTDVFFGGPQAKGKKAYVLEVHSHTWDTPIMIRVPDTTPWDRALERSPVTVGDLVREIHGADVSEWEIKREGPDLVGRGYVEE